MELSRTFALFLEDFCRGVHVTDIPPIEAVGCSSRKRRKPSVDYRVFVGKQCHSNLQPHLERLVRELLSASASWTVPLSTCRILSPQYLEVSLNRAAAYRSLFSFILGPQGTSCQQQERGAGANVLIFVPHSDESFTAIRTEMLAAYASRCYGDRNMGVNIYTSKPLHVLQRHAFHSVITCDQAFSSKTHGNDMVTDYMKFFEEGGAFDLKSYVASEGIDVSGHDLHLGKVSIESPAFVIARQLAHDLRNRSDTDSITVLVVAPACKSFVVQQAGLLCTTMLPRDQRNKKPQLTVLYLIHEGTFELCDRSFDDYLEQRRTFVMGAFQRPQADLASAGSCSFDESAMTGDSLQAAIDVLVETEVTYEFLSSKQNVKLKLRERLSHAEKGHYFSQYTLARIAAILDKYESSVKAGTYPALCQLEDIDFDLLCEESEWLLWHRLLLCWQVLREPMPQTLPGSVKVEVNAHTLLRALEALCTEFSAYYSKVRVLVHPEPHLNATVFARIWLIKAVQRTVLCVLNRFGLKGLDRM
uniref:DALR anticodon binding domain-containing protein n=1 Tax=Rhipicephalus pulchellus TaxID=72859 RepID=L7M568_RHIPC